MVASLFSMVGYIFLDDSMKIHLPYPISVNAMYRNVRLLGRVKSKRYREWRRLAICAFLNQTFNTDHVHGKVYIHIAVKRPDKRKRDIDNLAKGILDFLTDQEIIEDDHNVEKLTIEWIYEGPEGATITIEKIPDEKNKHNRLS